MLDDRRKYTRQPIVVNSICSIEGNISFVCKTRDMSYQGASLETTYQGRIGAKAILKICGVGALACNVIRVTSDGFAVEFDLQQSAREMLELDLFLLERSLSPDVKIA